MKQRQMDKILKRNQGFESIYELCDTLSEKEWQRFLKAYDLWRAKTKKWKNRFIANVYLMLN